MNEFKLKRSFKEVYGTTLFGYVRQLRMASSRIGRIEYEGYAQAMAIPPARQRWRMTYRVLLDGNEIERHVAEFMCHAASAEQVAQEARHAGFDAETQQDVVILSKRPPADR